MDLKNFISKVNALDPKEIILESAALSSKELADTNRSNLTKGELASGDQTEQYASINYTNWKSSLGSISAPNMDFKVTGRFHKGINVDIEGDNIVFNNSDSKADKILNNWGEDVEGVQEKQFSDIVRPHYMPVINAKLK